MSYINAKLELENEIIKLLKETSDIETLINVKNTLRKTPISIQGFVIDLFDKNYSEDMYKTHDILCAFEHEVRKIAMELGYDKTSEKVFKKINANSEYIDHYCELKVDGLELDLWISEDNDSPFDPREIAWVIYNIYCGRVVF